MTEEDLMELGGSIILSGFKEVDKRDMIVLKKIIGNYVKKFREQIDGYEELKLTIKFIHGENKKFEAKGEIIAKGKPHNSKLTHFNLFIGIDELLKKLESSIAKKL
jgi:hypothetical protein